MSISKSAGPDPSKSAVRQCRAAAGLALGQRPMVLSCLILGVTKPAMPQFLYRIRPTRLGMLTDGPTEREAQIVGEHFAYLRALTEHAAVLMAGRTLTADEHTFGIAASRYGPRAALQTNPTG